MSIFHAKFFIVSFSQRLLGRKRKKCAHEFRKTKKDWIAQGREILPSLKVHNFIDRVFLGRAFPRLHRRLDKPVFFLGRYHRKLFHDLPTAYFIGHKTYPDDPRVFESAYLHIHYDSLCTWDSEYRRYLERLAMHACIARKACTRKRRRKKKGDDFESLIRLMEFVVRLRSKRFSGWVFITSCEQECFPDWVRKNDARRDMHVVWTWVFARRV